MNSVNILEPAKDSLKWTIDFLIPLQMFSTFRWEIQRRIINCWDRPETMSRKRTLTKIDKETTGTELAAETATSMAAASLVFKESDSTYSSTLLKHAKQLVFSKI
ncbi:Endoglucanase 2 [Cardamine amara subsp. amara]|uniref:cellulase n=1 Tax=Cardamine amara subsp. amara TaxID=228776 RepID=A0ABD0ZUA4_CARAN